MQFNFGSKNSKDIAITRWMSEYGVLLLRISVGIVFLWFGVLKFFPGLSPATEIAVKTIETLTFSIISGKTALYSIAALEVIIGAGLIAGVFLRIILLLLLFQMVGTITPLFLFPSETFTQIPYAPTLEGQYIIKNIIIISAGTVIWATRKGGKLNSEPNRERDEKKS